jgi:DNA-binding transcriptional LysR family regulator
MNSTRTTGPLGLLATGSSWGSVMSATCSVLPDVVRVFRERYPGVELVMEESSRGQAIADLHNRRLHVAFVRQPVSDETLSIEAVLDEPLVVALREDHPLAARAKVPARALASEGFVIFPRPQGPGFYDQILSFCHAAGFSPRVVQEATQMQTILSLVAGGLGVALIPASVRSLCDRGVLQALARALTTDRHRCCVAA